MDLEEIGSLLLMIAIAVISGLVKRKKKQKSTYRAAPFVSDEIEFEKESENDFEMAAAGENSTMENDNFNENSPKSEPYFTYEEVREKETDYARQEETISQNESQVILQDSENEEETNGIDFSDPQELRKAVIYKEILENPYN
ncbi:MAG: hypothetical protein MJZ57_09105 [Bacteroidales bacterium]|nr:hypothetical protein [Bacteroidales bacterium]